ncbi:hypothetical protein KP77_06190 [Jeotgalibacillus alimentarius]|uniref:Aerobactin siderophore biosynthesis IucA/IucC-like C-terminal domain-containing protein n=1 Tax=Jeotgalibacillus alimentarius TaxID=135826 RepID=A0A0C2VUL4_9BACL|nr:hypothetical protein [Jeotgalibacillus alimentarius]KIL52592.1 hypothetical protein KP77_06190 [Jeotgalibacillus alimentarius]
MNQQELFSYIEDAFPVRFSETELGTEWNLSDWLDQDTAAEDLAYIQRIQEAPKLMVAGSLSMKRTAFTIVSVLLAHYKSGQTWDLSSSDVRLVHDPEAPFQLGVHLSGIQSYDRELSWDDLLRNLYFDWVKPLILSIEKAGKVKQIVLWENFYIYLRWFYKSLAPELKGLDQFDWESHWQSIVSEDFFGEEEPNPFTHLDQFKAKRQLEDARVRSTCCYKYMLPGKKNCRTCCLVKD